MIGFQTILMLAICLVSACAKPTLPATAEEQNKAGETYILCLRNAARAMDDHTSDAASIATAIKPRCAAEFSRSTETFGRSLNPEARRMFEQDLAGMQLEQATAVVLAEQAARR